MIIYIICLLHIIHIYSILYSTLYIDISDMRHIITILWSQVLTSNATAWHSSTWSSWHKAFSTAVASFVELSKITGKSSLRSIQKKPTEVHRRTGRFHHEKWWKMVIEPINTWWTCWDISIKHGEIWWFHVDLTMKADLTWGFKHKFWWQPGGFNWFNQQKRWFKSDTMEFYSWYMMAKLVNRIIIILI